MIEAGGVLMLVLGLLGGLVESADAVPWLDALVLAMDCVRFSLEMLLGCGGPEISGGVACVASLAITHR